VWCKKATGQTIVTQSPERQLTQKNQYIGEVLGHSYIKVVLELPNNPDHKYVNVPLKGILYEAISGRTYNIIGTYNQESFVWKLRCFDKSNRSYCRLEGKQNSDDGIDGSWSYKKTTRNFYLKKAD
jgi:hypothetical protein